MTIAFSSAAISVAVMSPAMAQSNASGIIYGRVEAPAGATVTMTNTNTGLKRSVTVGADGRYQATAMPFGHYKVELIRNGAAADSTEVDVVAGQGVDASFGGSQLAKVEVTARRTRIDISNTNNGAVFTAKELAKLPVQTNLTSVALLAPNTTAADAAYAGASFGGSGASENSYYVNGFPITNPMTQLGSIELPFGAIAQTSVITGGFGAEFGRSIGGVMNITTKSGTNNWEAGATWSTAPNSLRAKEANYYYGNTGYVDNKETDGKLHYRRDNSTRDVEQYGFYVGGPLIQDKLFMFIAADETRTRRQFLSDSSQAVPTGGVESTSLERDAWLRRRAIEQRYVAKFDWNITDNHRLEWTTVGDDYNEVRRTYGYILNPNNPKAREQLDGTPNDVMYSDLTTRNPGASGATVNMLKYTGNLTEDLTLTALYGELGGKRGVTYTGFGANPPPTVGVPQVVRRVPELDAQNLYRNFNKFPGNISKPGDSNVKSLRIDLEYKIGTHTVRGGIDHNRLSLTNAGLERSGGATYTFSKVPAGSEFERVKLGSGQSGIVGNFGGYGPRGYYVSSSKFSSITDASATQSSQYLEDRWNVTKDVLLTMGLRNDGYSNTNGEGVKFIDKKTQIAPRLAASWDVNGDASLKVFGSAGRYFLQLPTQVAARAASRSTLVRQDFTYSGIDPATGVPTGLVAITGPISPDGEYGQKKDPRSVVTRDLKSNYQDEVTLGFEQAYSPSLNYGAKVTFRKLGAGIDDNCDNRRLFKFAQDHGIEVHDRNAMQCFIFNPGYDATVWVDGHDTLGNPIVTGKGQWVNFSAAELGYPKAERKYTALDVFLEHPLRNGWYAKVNYTLSRSKGNMEGQTRSDTGQQDVGTTAAWDFPEFMTYASGVLPNDRLHALKAYGFYEFSKEWSVGFNALIQSGRPKACLGTDIEAEDGLKDPYGKLYGGSTYGAEYMWCAGKPAPRGSLGRLPTEKRLDLNLTYTPSMVKGLGLKLDVFNVFNAKTVLARQETYDDGSGETVQANYGEARSVQSPRSMKFTVEYNHKF
jgi:hypothetical protein